MGGNEPTSPWQLGWWSGPGDPGGKKGESKGGRTGCGLGGGGWLRGWVCLPGGVGKHPVILATASWWRREPACWRVCVYAKFSGACASACLRSCITRVSLHTGARRSAQASGMCQPACRCVCVSAGTRVCAPSRALPSVPRRAPGECERGARPAPLPAGCILASTPFTPLLLPRFPGLPPARRAPPDSAVLAGHPGNRRPPPSPRPLAARCWAPVGGTLTGAGGWALGAWGRGPALALCYGGVQLSCGCLYGSPGEPRSGGDI